MGDEETNGHEGGKEPAMKAKRRGHKPKMQMAIHVVFAVLLIGALALLAFDYGSGDKGFSEAVRAYYTSYPDAVLTFQRFSGEAAASVTSQIRGFCEDFSLKEYYLAEIVSQKHQKSVAYVLNPESRKVECLIEQDFGLTTAQAGVAPNLLATVNGEPVLSEEVMVIFNSIPANLRTNTSLQDAFDQAINNKLMLQEASRLGLQVSADELDSAVNNLLAQSGLTMEGLETALLQANSSIAKFRNDAKKDLLIQKMIQEIAKTAEGVSEEEVRAFYDAYKENLTTVPRSATSQLMIYANQSTAQAKLEYAKSIASQINATNFCDLVATYSEDLATKNNCGLYTANAGELLPEYEEIVYSSQPGDIKLIATRLGYHIVQVLDIAPARPLSYEEAHDDIADLIAIQKRQAALAGYIKSLRDSAEIVSYVQGQ